MSSYVRKRLTFDDITEMRMHLASHGIKISNDPSCDFCGDSHPMWVYAAIRMSTGEMVDNWRWSACEDCGATIEAHNWTRIEDKMVDWLKLRFKDAPRDILRIVAKENLKDFHQYAKPSRGNKHGPS